MGIIENILFGKSVSRNKKIEELSNVLEKSKDKLFLFLTNKTTYVYETAVDRETEIFARYKDLEAKLETTSKLFENEKISEIEKEMILLLEETISVYNEAIDFLKS